VVTQSGLDVDVDVVPARLAPTARQRAVIYFTYWVDLPAADVAVAVGASQRTVERELTPLPDRRRRRSSTWTRQ
jgi:DNA-directed RNA polymerase specialized sigma24 family protein